MKRQRTPIKAETEEPVTSKYFAQHPQQQQQQQQQQHQQQLQNTNSETNTKDTKTQTASTTTTTTQTKTTTTTQTITPATATSTSTETRKLTREDFQKPGLELAKFLLGKIIIRKKSLGKSALKNAKVYKPFLCSPFT